MTPDVSEYRGWQITVQMDGWSGLCAFARREGVSSLNVWGYCGKGSKARALADIRARVDAHEAVQQAAAMICNAAAAPGDFRRIVDILRGDG